MGKYKQNFINEAIFRLDFAVSIEELKTSINRELSKIISDEFPIFESNQVPFNSVFVDQKNLNSKDGVKIETGVQSEWKFYGRNREKYVTLNSNVLIISYKEYESFASFSDNINRIVKKMYDIFDDVQIKRMGIRYINTITLNSENLFDWTGYINDALLSQLSFKAESSDFTRLLTKLEYKYGYNRLTFQYGMFNPNYPSKIKDKVFVLDYDYSTDSFTDNPKDVIHFVNEAHDAIEEMFEKSIEDELRKEMKIDE